MEEKYFDHWEFQKIVPLLATNPLEAKNRFEQYLKKYPKDYSAYTYYVGSLIVLRELKKAEAVLNYLEKTYKKDLPFVKYSDRVHLLENDIVYNRLRILSLNEKYEELYELCKKHSKQIEEKDLEGFVFYCRTKVGKANDEDRKTHSYLFRQTLEYSEKEFLKHIKKHQADYNCMLDNPNQSILVPDFPLEEVIEEIKKYLLTSERTYPGFYEDEYVFKYDGCGRVENKLVNYFKVICFHNTKNMITIFPSATCQNLPYIDLNYMIKEDNSKNKSKRISQIEKFNNRFKRK